MSGRPLIWTDENADAGSPLTPPPAQSYVADGPAPAKIDAPSLPATADNLVAPASSVSAADAPEAIVTAEPPAVVSDAAPVFGSNATLADYLVNGYWVATGRQHHQFANPANVTVNLSGLALAGEVAQARAAMRAWERVANIHFTETSGSAQITFTDGNNNSTYVASTTGVQGTNWVTPSGNITSMTITISQFWYNNNGGYGGAVGGTHLYDNYSFQTYIHELGHAIGLGHQGNYNAGGGPITYGVSNNFTNDSWQNTVMSYFDQTNYGGASFAYVSGPQMIDILAIQTIYGGATTSTHYYGDAPTVTGEGYNFANGVQSFTMYSSDGWAALESSSYSGSQTINMNKGTYSSVRGETNNISLYTQTTMTSYVGGAGADDVTLSSDAPPSGSGGYYISTAGGSDIIRGNGSAVAHVIDGGAGTDTYARSSLTLGTGVLKHTSQSSNVWTYDNGAGLSVDTLYNVENFQFSNGTVALRQAKSNFNFTGANDVGATSDVLLQNGGIVVDWIMQNGAFSSSNVITNTGPGYNVKGTGDFNGDGVADILLQNGGTVVDWIMKNGVYQSGNVLTNGAVGWNIVGTGDFNNDGTQDVLLQNGGTVVDWIMKDGVYQSGNVITNGAAGWTVVGTGDFNGDGSSDVLLQNGGTVVEWLMSGGAFSSGKVITNGAAGWTVKGTGDFNGDGTSDIVLQNGNVVVDWIMSNGNFSSGNTITNNAGGYTVVGTGDYTGDGTADILLQNGGTIVNWRMQNGVFSSGSVVTTGAAGWSVVG